MPKEIIPTRRGVLVDREAGERFVDVADTLRRVLVAGQSPLLEEYKHLRSVDEADINLWTNTRRVLSPLRKGYEWRPKSRATTSDWHQRKIENGRIADNSFYGNWESPDGPLEHIELATRCGMWGMPIILQHLKDPNEVDDPRIADTIKAIRDTNQFLVIAGVAMHDDGRLVTHLPSNGPIGKAMLRKIGVRPDIAGIIPDEETFFGAAPDEDMNERMINAGFGRVLVTLFDNFSKRFPKSNRLYKPDDFTPEKMQAWADGYGKRPYSGRPSEKRFKDMLQLHVDNEKRVFDGLGWWLQSVTDLTLDQFTSMMNERFAPELPQLPLMPNVS